MKISEARMKANQANSARSTGPRTSAGKEKSRANAYKNVLCATVLVSPKEAEILRDGVGNSPAAGTFGGWLEQQIVLNSQRIDQCQATEQALRERITLRARLTWSEDRRREATLLGTTLATDPEGVVVRLRETLHGVEWLLARWAMLAHAARVQTTWTPEQVKLAFDLSGLPPEFRVGYEMNVGVNFDGQAYEFLETHAAIAQGEIEELKIRREDLIEFDEAARAQAEAGLLDDSDPALKRHRRHESTLQGRLRWAIKQLEQAALAGAKTEDEFEDEDELTVPEATEECHFPNRSASRVEKKLQKAAARREARLRKLEKLRN